MSYSTLAEHSPSLGRALGLALAGAAGLWLVLAAVTAARAASATLPPTLEVNDLTDAPAAAPYNDGVCATDKTGGHSNGKCTLRAAIMEANHYLGGGVTIRFAPTFMDSTVALSRLPLGADDETTGDLNISQTTHIEGLVNGGPTAIDAHALGDRVFHLESGAVVDMSDLVLQNGTAGSQGGGGVLVDSGAALSLSDTTVWINTDNSGQGGGGIRNRGTLTLTEDEVGFNIATGPGGGVANDGVAAIEDSVIVSNQSAYWGGGLFTNGPRLNIAWSFVESNTANNYGGGLAASEGQTTVSASTFKGNFTQLDGGALEAFVSGQVNVINSTLTANDAVGYGGGLEANQNGVVSLYNATVSDNVADYFLTGNGKGGGLSFGGAGTVNLQNSLIADNYASVLLGGVTWIRFRDDCFGAPVSKGYNLLTFVSTPDIHTCGFTPGVGDQVTTTVNLGVLQGNGGPTPTQALLPGSAAIDAGNPKGCDGPLGVPLLTDQRQRGFPRVANGAGTYRCDIGAYEVQRLLYLPLTRR